jgi:GTP-binding protein
VAFEKAALLVMVVDNQTGMVPLDQELAQLLRGTGKPFVVAVNKVDAVGQEAHAAEFHSLGAKIFPIAAEHGTGVDDLLDFALQLTSPEQKASELSTGLLRAEMVRGMRPHEAATAADDDQQEEKDLTEIAIIGRPNVGKSTLLNRMAGEERSIVSPIPGTTVDSVDTDVTRDGKLYRFVDTAGIRRKGKTNLVAEKLSVVMARRGLERCDLALLIVDGEMGVTQGDAQIASYAEESGRSVIVVVNKWDLAVAAAQLAANRQSTRAGGKARRKKGETSLYQEPPARTAGGAPGIETVDRGRLMVEYEELIRKKLKFLSYAPIVFLSAKSGERAEKLFPLIDHVAAARKRKISTPELNRWLKSIDLQRGTLPKSRPIRIYYVTQAKTAPPTFLLFTNQKQPLHFAYERFLENQLRAKFDFMGTPVRWVQRLRKRERDGRGPRDED